MLARRGSRRGRGATIARQVQGMRWRSRAFLGLGLALVTIGGAVVICCHGGSSTPSTCFGSPGAGALAHGWRLPASGPNFSAYSSTGWALGRTYVHSAVYPVMLDAYASLRDEHPTLRFVYGETGLVRGGRFRPHRTHENGLSVDFMVPVLSPDGKVGTLPTSPVDKFGYGLEFDASGHSGHYSIDFETMALHLAALRAAAERHRVGIARVIFAPDLQRHLRRTKAWPMIRRLPFSARPSWVRHDEHYHVDFRVPCQQLSRAR